MNNADFWASIRAIIAEGFTPEGLLKLDGYAEQFISGKLVYQRFSPQEQHGCSAGGTTNVIASFSREQKLAQIQRIKQHSATTKESANLVRNKKL